MQIRIETKRLVIRSAVEEDFEDFYIFATHPDVGPRAGWPAHTDKVESKKIFDALRAKPRYFCITLKGEDKFIGSIEVMDRKDHPYLKEVGYVLAYPYWGQGIMTEALAAMVDYSFETISEMRYLICSYFAPNLASGRVMQKCGFTYDGVMRLENKWIDGTPVDRILTSISRETWESKKA